MQYFSKYVCTKGQLISKCLFGTFNSPKKRTKKFDFTKGQLISKLLFGVIVSTKTPTRYCKDFCSEIFCSFLKAFGASWGFSK